MSDLNEVGERDGWRCWLCDKPVDPDASVNSDLGPSADGYALTKNKNGLERLAHRACNTMKGKIAPVAPWTDEIVVADAAPLIETVERLERKGGREVVGRCMDEADAKAASEWLLDRLSRLAPGKRFSVDLKSGGGQYLLSLSTN